MSVLGRRMCHQCHGPVYHHRLFYCLACQGVDIVRQKYVRWWYGNLGREWNA